MKVPLRVALWARRMAAELHRYEVDTLPSGEPWRVRRDPPASLPGFEHVASYAAFEDRGSRSTGPHAEECDALLSASYAHWLEHSVEGR